MDETGVLDVTAIEEESLDLLSPVSLSTIVARSTPMKKPAAIDGKTGLLNAFDDVQEEDLLL